MRRKWIGSGCPEYAAGFGSSPRNTGDIRLPIPLADLRRELPEHVLVNAITGHSKTHEGIGEQLIQRDLLVSRELTAGPPAEWHMSNSFRNSASLENTPAMP